MRDALQDAGLVCGGVNSDSSEMASMHPVMMVLEPEAASIYCHVRGPTDIALRSHVPRVGSPIAVTTMHPLLTWLLWHCPISQHKLSAELALSAGGATMCVDCGGGTVDIIVHRQEERSDGSLVLREVVKGTGDCCGAAAVDAAFIRLIADTIPVFDEYANRNPQEVVVPCDSCAPVLMSYRLLI